MVDEITPEGYALLMRAPDLAHELLQERDLMEGALKKVREWLKQEEGAKVPIDCPCANLSSLDDILEEADC